MVRISVCLCMIALLVCVLPMAAQQPAGTRSANESAAPATPDAEVAASVSGSGTTNYIPLWTNSTTLGSSVLLQSGTGSAAKIGVLGEFDLLPAGTATATAGFISRTLNLAASAFSSTTSTSVRQTFRWQAEPAGNNTSTPSATLNLLFGEGATAPSETGLNIASNGQISFAKGQTFPGVGTVTSVGSGLGLIGGPITTSGTVAIDPTVVPQLNTANTFTGNQTVNGNVNVVGGVISVGGSRTLSCTLSCGPIFSIPNGGQSTFSLGKIAAPPGYSLTGCSAYWALTSSCGTIVYPSGSSLNSLDDGAGACHALGFNGSGSTLESCACATACQLP